MIKILKYGEVENKDIFARINPEDNVADIVTEIIDWFGKDVKFNDETDDEVTAEVRVSKMAMKFWAMQYGEHITVTAPESLVNEIKDALQKAVEKYN